MGEQRAKRDLAVTAHGCSRGQRLVRRRVRDQACLVRGKCRNRKRLRAGGAHVRGHLDDRLRRQLRDDPVVADINDLNIGAVTEESAEQVDRRLAVIGAAALHEQVWLVMKLRIAVQVEQVPLDIHDLLGSAARFEKFLHDKVVLVVVAQVVRGHGPEVVDDVPGQLDVGGDLVTVNTEQCGQDLLAVDAHRTYPREVIQPGMPELHGFRRHVQPPGEQPLEADRHVAEADRAVAVVEERTRHDAHRIGEIDNPRVVRRELSHPVGDPEDHRHGTERLGESAGTRGLLTDAPAAKRDGLVGEACGLTPHADLQKHG